MEFIIKKADHEDIESLVDYRMDFLYQLTGKRQPEGFKKATRDYLCRNMGGGSLLCYIATCNEQIASSIIICIYDVIPKTTNITGKVGYVFNVYTLSEFRGRGLAAKLLETAIGEARRLGVGELYLSATEDGKKIYEKLQFGYQENEMYLKLI